MTIADTLAETPVSDLDLSRFVRVGPDDTVAGTVRAMAEADRSCALVMAGSALAGIFTQRDVVQRVVGHPGTWDVPISEQMTRQLRTMRDTDSVADGLAVMNEWWVRSVPVLDADDEVVGNLSFWVVMRTISGLVHEMLRREDGEAGLEHGLGFVDFTGLPTSAAVSVNASDPVSVAAHQMRARGIGSVMVVDERDSLVGILTEFDLLAKIGCDQPDLAVVTVGEVMSGEPVALKKRASIAEALDRMAESDYAHIPLLGESGRLVAVASFRDIAAYVESSLRALA